MVAVDSVSVTTQHPAAVLWDMDGTLVDSEPYWMQAETELVRSFGGTWSHDDGLALIGSGLWNSAKYLQSRGVSLEADDIVSHLTGRVQEQIHKSGVPWRPGSRELLKEIRDAKIPTALVTMSIRSMAEQVAAEIPFDAFDLIVAGDEVPNPKPHPEAYLMAAKQLSVRAEEAIAFEDSLAGLTSAVEAGTIAIGVPHIITLPESSRHTIWPTLRGRTLDDLNALFRNRFPQP